MSSTVVVSVQYAGGLRRDLELPLNVPVGTLAANIARAILSTEEDEGQPAYRCILKRLDSGEVFKREKSLDDYAVVHGEILELIQQASPGHAVGRKEQPRFSGPGFIDSSGLVFRIDTRHVVVGRANPATGALDPSVTLDLTQVDTLEAPTIAERQAEIRFQSDQFLICQISKDGGTILNLQPLEPHQPVTLRHGDHICFGDAKLVFVWDGRNPPAT
jgi:uncharacterized ubiquitin-like protein YukD